MPHDPIVLDPPDFDQQTAWDRCKPYMDRVVDEEGNFNMGAAMGADPGVCSCPNCHTYYWKWGIWQQCKECGMEFHSDAWGRYSAGVQRARSGRGPGPRHGENPWFRYGYEHPDHGWDIRERYHDIPWLQVMGKQKWSEEHG